MYIHLKRCYNMYILGVEGSISESVPLHLLTFKESEVYYMTFDRKAYRYQYEKEKLKRIHIDVPKEKYDEIKAHADSMGEKVNQFIKRAIDEAIARDKK